MENTSNTIFEWAETLPNDCPPEDALLPQNDNYYRLVKEIPPTDSDFWSHRKLYPSKPFNINECITRACSLINNLKRCNNLTKLPPHKDKKVVQIILPPESGLVKKTGARSSHFSWWRAKDFDVIQHCSNVNSQI